MSLHLDFEPHSWYRGAAIQKIDVVNERYPGVLVGRIWNGYIENGNTYRVDTFTSLTIGELKQQITDYHKRNANRDAYNRAQIGE